MPPNPAFHLEIRRLRLDVRLGYGEAERGDPQPVEIDLAFTLPTLPAACGDDDAAFLCYDALAARLGEACEGREFRLIEFLAHELLAVCRAHVDRQPGIDGARYAISLTLNKIAVPIAAVRGGCAVTLVSPGTP